MRPIFAIAPLAAVFVLVGPTPHEANVMLSRFWERLIPGEAEPKPDLPEQTAKQAPTQVAKPTLRQPASTLATTLGTLGSKGTHHGLQTFEAGLKPRAPR